MRIVNFGFAEIIIMAASTTNPGKMLCENRMSKKPPIFAQSRGGGDGGFSVFGAQGGLSAFGQAQSFRYATNSVTPACPSGTDKRTFVQPTGFFLRDTPKGRALSKLV